MSKEKKREETLKTPKGMHDILPEEGRWWDKVNKTTEKVTEFYGFQKIETPLLEHAGLFARTVGEDTDIVQKEMYTVKTKGGDVLALRPEGTASIARAFLEHSLSKSSPLQKFWYEGAMFRYENPQAGRLRQFHQIGFEILGGVGDPMYDAQVIIAMYRLLEDLRIKNVTLRINSIGCKVCRSTYKKQLQSYYKNTLKKLCTDCNKRYKDNPLRLLDCKNEKCQTYKEDAPSFFDKLCSNCSSHLRSVLEYMDELGVPYILDNQLVRGLDYYSKTVFEFYAEGENSWALGGGGRYDYLVEMLGGRATPGVGGAFGVERIIETMKSQGVNLPDKAPRKVFIVHVGDLAKKKSLNIIEELRHANISVTEALSKDSLKAQLKAADKEGAAIALILGQKEIFEGNIIIRDLKNSLQESVPMARMIDEIKKRLK